jgi:putative exosortase-associated protein (TIGR04073 family)
MRRLPCSFQNALYKPGNRVKLALTNIDIMRNKCSFLASAAITLILASGCANIENKFGRGLSNTLEVVRLGEFSRTVEQTGVFESPNMAYTTGVVRGINRTLARTGVGVYEMVTAPFPPYGPVFTDYLSPAPAHPDNNVPGLMDDSLFATDTTLGFSGGEVAPIVPGSRFTIFEGQ